MLKRFSESFQENPGAWILLFILGLSIADNYHTSAQFTKVCENIQAEIDFGIKWHSKFGQDIEGACNSHMAEPPDFND